MIVAEGLTKCFGDFVAVEDFSVVVPRGEIFGLVGPDGAGKTTVIRLLAGVARPTRGRVLIEDKDVISEPEAIRRIVAYMPQKFSLYGDLSVQQNLRFYAELFGIPRGERERKMEELLSFARLIPFKKRLARDLSGGMKQKLGLACALMHEPNVIFLDEPTNGVDPISRREFWAILYDLVARGVTIFLSTAYLDEAERCSRVGLMMRGRLVRCDTPAALKEGIEHRVFEAETYDATTASAIIGSTEGVIAVKTTGDRVRFLADMSVLPRKELARRLAKSACIKRLTRMEPIMEDIFISVLKGGSETN